MRRWDLSAVAYCKCGCDGTVYVLAYYSCPQDRSERAMNSEANNELNKLEKKGQISR